MSSALTCTIVEFVSKQVCCSEGQVDVSVVVETGIWLQISGSTSLDWNSNFYR